MSEAAVSEGASAGALLREAREAAGLHVATLAANLKVPVRKLEALEQDRYDLLPDAVFVRALASSVCRTLKVDPQPVLERLPQTSQPRLVPDTEGINAPFRSPSDGPKPGLLHMLMRPVPLTVAALLLGALVLVMLPALQGAYETLATAAREAAPAAADGAPTADAQVAAFPAAPPGSESQPLSLSSPGGSPQPSGTVAPDTPLAPAALPAPATSPVTASAAPAAAPAPSVPAGASGDETAAAPVPANAVVVFRTRGPSWIQVTDAGGTTVLRRLMGPGESAGAAGTLPLSVTVGAAEQTDVQVRGKPFNLGPLARDNVARFEVK